MNYNVNACFVFFYLLHYFWDFMPIQVHQPFTSASVFEQNSSVMYLPSHTGLFAHIIIINKNIGMSKKAYVEAILSGIDSAIAECQENVYVR